MAEWYENAVYIKMCSKADEIQELKPCFFGKNFWAGENNTAHVEDYIWLPTQEQLQKMIDCTGYMFTFHERWSEKEPKQLEWVGERAIHQWFVIGLSMNQLWLAFVMKEKYSKIWDGEEWVKCVS